MLQERPVQEGAIAVLQETLIAPERKEEPAHAVVQEPHALMTGVGEVFAVQQPIILSLMQPAVLPVLQYIVPLLTFAMIQTVIPPAHQVRMEQTPLNAQEVPFILYFVRNAEQTALMGAHF